MLSPDIVADASGQPVKRARGQVGGRRQAKRVQGVNRRLNLPSSDPQYLRAEEGYYNSAPLWGQLAGWVINTETPGNYFLVSPADQQRNRLSNLAPANPPATALFGQSSDQAPLPPPDQSDSDRGEGFRSDDA